MIFFFLIIKMFLLFLATVLLWSHLQDNNSTESISCSVRKMLFLFEICHYVNILFEAKKFVKLSTLSKQKSVTTDPVTTQATRLMVKKQD